MLGFTQTRTHASAAPFRTTWRLALVVMLALLATATPPPAEAAPKPKPRTTSISLVPTVTGINVANGQLVASGFVTATIKGTTTNVPFTGVPVNIALAQDQTGAAAAGCPILDLTLGPINLNLLGLVVQTSPICLTITAYQGGGLLGDLLCSVAHLLDGGLTLQQILGGLGLVDPLTSALLALTPGDVTNLLAGLTNLFNAALGNLLNAVLQAIDVVNAGHTCAILHLALGPVDLTLLGLNVHLDNCANGPVTVDITAVTGRGNLLGNLLCELLDGGLLNLGATLQGLLQQLIGLLTA